MKPLIQTATTLTGMLAVALLTLGFGDEVRNLANGTADSALAMAVPFLVLTAVIAGLTSASTAIALNIMAGALMALALSEGEGTTMGIAGLVALAAMTALLVIQSRSPEA